MIDRAAPQSTEIRGVAVPDARDQLCDTPDRQNERVSDPLETPRLADADQCPHQQAEIESAGVHDQAFVNILMATQMRSPHPSRVVDVGERPLDQLASSTHQSLASRPPNPSPVRVDRGLRLWDCLLYTSDA